MLKPSGKGRRIVIAAAITEEGWLGADQSMTNWRPDTDDIYENGSIRCWLANVHGDYHENFNTQNFLSYFEDCVLANLTEPSTIVLDRASYHTAIPEDAFNPLKARKDEIKDWLIEQNIEFDKEALKEELKMLALCHWEPPLSIIEEMAIEHGLKHFEREHKVIFLPPYHPEYNAIEMAWGRVKHYVGMHPAYNINVLLEKTLPMALAECNATKIEAIITHVRKKIIEHSQQEVDIEDIELRIQEYDEEA